MKRGCSDQRIAQRPTCIGPPRAGSALSRGALCDVPLVPPATASRPCVAEYTDHLGGRMDCACLRRSMRVVAVWGDRFRGCCRRPPSCPVGIGYSTPEVTAERRPSDCARSNGSFADLCLFPVQRSGNIIKLPSFTRRARGVGFSICVHIWRVLTFWVVRLYALPSPFWSSGGVSCQQRAHLHVLRSGFY